jgi:hypothetical protein
VRLLDTEKYTVFHSVREDFGPLMRSAFKIVEKPAIAALGPIYDDPAAAVLAPFIRSAKEAGFDPDSVRVLAPKWALEKAQMLRATSVLEWGATASERSWDDVHDWTRAGLVLEIASRLGIPLRNGTKVHVRWKLKGTVTGRFGVEHGSFNPLTISREHRSRIVADGPGRDVVALDFRAMDLCSIISLFPALQDRYAGAEDPHARTADLVGIDREVAKKELFVFAYGGHSSYQSQFSERLPELVPVRGADLARRVQEKSALAFRAGLSRALPHLFGGHVRPMFTVHDELVLDVERDHIRDVDLVIQALEQGASERNGVPYSVGMKVGRDYAEAKE